MTPIGGGAETVVIVVTYNSEVDIEVCLRSLAAHFPQLAMGRAQVHIVDNASTDNTPATLQRLSQEFDWLTVHLLSKNVGFGAANNLVLNSLSANAFILLNADAWLVADSFSPALEHLASNPETAVLGLPLVYPDGAPQTYAFLPSAWHRWLMVLMGFRLMAKALIDFWPTKFLMQSLPFSHNFLINHDRPSLDLEDSSALGRVATGEVKCVSWVAGAAMVLSPDFLRQSGGFDPKIFLYGEDEDLCIQAKNLGFRVQTLQTTPVVHKLGWGGERGFQPRVARMKYTSLRYFIRKNVKTKLNRAVMTALLPFYVYGRNLGHFFCDDSQNE